MKQCSKPILRHYCKANDFKIKFQCPYPLPATARLSQPRFRMMHLFSWPINVPWRQSSSTTIWVKMLRIVSFQQELASCVRQHLFHNWFPHPSLAPALNAWVKNIQQQSTALQIREPYSLLCSRLFVSCPAWMAAMTQSSLLHLVSFVTVTSSTKPLPQICIWHTHIVALIQCTLVPWPFQCVRQASITTYRAILQHSKEIHMRHILMYFQGTNHQ